MPDPIFWYPQRKMVVWLCECKNNFCIWQHSDELFERQTFHTSLNPTYLFLKVMTLPQPRKVARDRQKQLSLINT